MEPIDVALVSGGWFLPEADLSLLLLLLLLPDNLNEVSPLESPLLAARYLMHIPICVVFYPPHHHLSPRPHHNCQVLPVTIFFLLLSAIVRLDAAFLDDVVQVEIPAQHNFVSTFYSFAIYTYRVFFPSSKQLI